MGDLEEVERLQAGVRDWLLRAARTERHELRGAPAAEILPVLCAAAFGPPLSDPSRPAGAAAVASIGVLAAVRADALARLLGRAAEDARATHGEAGPEIGRQIGEILAARDQGADELRSDIAMVMQEIDAGGTMLRAAIEAGQQELQRDVLAAVEAVSTEFGEMAFMLADLARAAGEIQDSLDGQDAELRFAGEQAGRQAADVRMIREELAVIQRRSRPWPEGPEGPEGRTGPGWASGCPYLGLLSYDQAHEAVFRGRERLTAELAGKVAGAGIVIVTGPPGSGKTSLLQAGLVPALARGVQVPGSASWPRVSITAAARPLTGLAAGLAGLAAGVAGTADRDQEAVRRALAVAPGDAHLLIREILVTAAGRDAAPDGRDPGPNDRDPGPDDRDPGRQVPGDALRLVLIIDQFERVLMADDDEGRRERAAFIEAVCAAATRPAGSRGEPPARVVIAVRGDHWDRCAAYPRLLEAMQRDQVVVGPVPEDGLRRVITGPAQASGERVDPALTDVILADLGTADREQTAAVLPFLSQALLLTWERRAGGLLTADGYQAAGLRGRIARAVEVSAEHVYGGLTSDQQAIARDVFRRLTTAEPDGQPGGRPASRADLDAGHDRKDVAAVLEAFAGRSLLIVDAGKAEIAHDVLLRAWPRLRGWLEEDQASVILHGRLAEDAARWSQHGRDPSGLYRDVQLAAVRQAARVWEGDPGRYPALTAAEAAFLRAAGRTATRGKWRLRALAVALVVVLVATLTGAGLAVRSARHSAGQQRAADASASLAAQSTALDAADPAMAALLAGAAWRIAPTAQARYSLLESLAQPVRGVLASQSGVVTALAAGPGAALAAGYQDGTIRLWDLASHRLIASTTWGAAPLALAFTGGGKSLEIADADAIGTWNPASGHAGVTAQPLAGAVSGGAAAFSPDGKALATGGDDGNLRLWEVATRQEIGAPMSSNLTPVEAVTFSPDGSTVAAASSNGAVQLWDAATQQEDGSSMLADSAAVPALAFSPDGRLLATGGDDGNVRLWEVATQTQDGATMATGSPVAALTFGTGGTTLATAQRDGSAGLWDVATQSQAGASLTTQDSSGLSALAFGPGVLAAGRSSGSIDLWDPAIFHQASAPLATGGPDAAVLDGGILAVSDSRGTIGLWNPVTRQPVTAPIATSHAVTGLAVSADGRTLAVAGDGVQLWTTATGHRMGAPLPGSDAAGPVAFSPDGSLLAAVGRDGQVRLWSVATQQPAGRAMAAGGPAALAFSPGGKTLVTVSATGQARLWSVATQRQVGTLVPAAVPAAGQPAAGGQASAGTGAAAAAFSPDGSTVATVGADGTVRLWDTATQQEVGPPMTATSQPVYALAFSPDGSTLAAAGADGTVRLWDTATQQEVGPPMTATSQPVYALAFSPDGGTLTTAGADGTARQWDVSFPAGLVTAACALAGQSLTRQQWAAYAGSQPFQQVCLPH